MKTSTLAYDLFNSPIGELLVVTDGYGLTKLAFDELPTNDMARDRDALRPYTRELTEYFAGERKKFSFKFTQDGTAFQKHVWDTLMTIPYGKTISYGELAEKVGNPKASRAVGSANGRNHIAIVVPCHRVIASGGKLGGYGGELWRKEWLLNLERSR